jgi:hypothetical protein
MMPLPATLRSANDMHAWTFLIDFQDYLPKSKNWYYGYQNDYKWTPSEQNYFGGLIVKDIRIVEKIPN